MSWWIVLNQHQSRSSPRKRGPRARERKIWIPACAGMSGPRSMQSAARLARGLFRRVLLEQLGKLLGHHAAELLGIHDRDGTAIIARDVMTDADRDQLDRRTRLDLLDHPAQMLLQIVAGIDRERRVVDRRAVGDHHQDLA